MRELLGGRCERYSIGGRWSATGSGNHACTTRHRRRRRARVAVGRRARVAVGRRACVALARLALGRARGGRGGARSTETSDESRDNKNTRAVIVCRLRFGTRHTLLALSHTGRSSPKHNKTHMTKAKTACQSGRACARHIHSADQSCRSYFAPAAGRTFGVAVERARGSSESTSLGRHVRAGALPRAGASVFASATPAAVAGAISVAVWSGKRVESAALAAA